MAFEIFRDKLQGYAENNIENTKYVMCVVTDMEGTAKDF